MNALTTVLIIPAAAAAILALVRDWRVARWLNVLASLGTFAAACALFVVERPPPGGFLLVDDFNIYLIALTAFVALTTALFSATYIAHEVETGRLTPTLLRFYHAMYQAFVWSMLMALAADNLGLMWVAVEAATLSTALMVSLYRTPAAIEAAWKYFILCGVGVALALFGTMLTYLAAQPVMGGGMPAITFTALLARAAEFDAALLNVAFVFLLAGYGTKVGLAPFHAWLPDAHAEGPTPISAVLSGLLLNVALYAVLRCKMLLAANPGALAPGPLMIAMGLGSLLLASLMLYRRRDIKRLFAYSSIEHMGICAFAFGIGGPLANFAGLLHMTMHSLVKSAIFFTVGHISQVKGTQRISEIGGLTRSHPVIGWSLLAGVLAIAGLPPFGVFTSEFLIVSSAFAREPLLALPFAAGLLLGFGALILRLQEFCFGPATPNAPTTTRPSILPVWLHLGLALTAGVWLPEPLVVWFRAVARLLG